MSLEVSVDYGGLRYSRKRLRILLLEAAQASNNSRSITQIDGNNNKQGNGKGEDMA